MKKIHNLPAWFNHDLENHEQFIETPEIVVSRDGKFYFDGMLGTFLKLGKTPHAVEVALDAEGMSCLARLAYGQGSDEEAVFVPFEIESFALIWNADPKTIHGMKAGAITLCLKAADTRYPIVTSAGVIMNLFLRDGRFRIEPDAEHSLDTLGEAA